jgi:phage-related minor tail protein
LAKQEQKINAKIEQIGNNTKLTAEKRDQQIAKQQGKLDNVQAQRTILSNFSEGITQLGNSKTVYTFNTVEASPNSMATLSSMSDGTVVINNFGTTGNRVHETNHAIQYDNGKITFKPLGSNNAMM